MLPKALIDPLAKEIAEGTTSKAAVAKPDPCGNSRQEDGDGFVQGLDRQQIRELAEKIYDLLLDELRLEQERHGRGGYR